jgi:phosphoribosylformylglycinamidine synthase
MMLSLTDKELLAIAEGMKRAPNDVELSIFDAQWAEHCSYKSSRSLLSLLPSKGKRVILGPGYDAGVLDIDNNQIITIHMESHNHPSAVDPYGGAATGVGGVLRDILGVGTRPIAILDSLRFGDIENSAKSRWLFKNVVRGIADYGNCVGIPTVGGEVEFDESYERNCLVDVVSLGLGRRKEVVLAEASHPGDILMLVGGRTGRDGIHGSSFASRDLSTGSEDRSAVQIPDPLTKKLILEATLEVHSSGHVRGLKDLGGGGLACALSEVADKGGTGLDIDLASVHLREGGMSPTEILISESQERMLFVIEDDFKEMAAGIFRRYHLPYSVIGKVTRSRRLVVRVNETIVGDVPVELVANAPLQIWPAKKPKYLESQVAVEKPHLPTDISKTIIKVITSPNLASKKWVYEQFDYEVGLHTVLKPGDSGASVLRITDDKFIAISVDGRPNHCYLNPREGAMGAIAEAARNTIAVGAEPIALVDHLQFGNPSDPEVFWTFSQSVQGIADYCRFFDLPCVGGKVSFYNEAADTKRAIKPSPVIAVLGLLKGAHHIRSRKFSTSGRMIVMIGMTENELGGSEYYRYIHKISGGLPPRLDFDKERGAQRLVGDAVKVGLLDAIDDCSAGGLVATISKMCIAGGVGARIELESILSDCKRWDDLLFSESHSRFVVTLDADKYQGLANIARNHQIPCSIIGNVEGDRLVLSNSGEEIFSEDVNTLEKASEAKIPSIMGH